MQNSRNGAERLAKGLGWFSVGLGLAQVAAPGAIANLTGLRDSECNRSRLRGPLYGLRELTAGAGILTQQQPAGWVWSRVAGDAMDLASLFMAMQNPRNNKGRLIASTVAVAGVTALDIYCAQQLSRGSGERDAGDEAVHVSQSVLVNRPVDEVYAYWRDFRNLPRFMNHLESVETPMGGMRSHWVAKAPLGTSVEWDAEITEDVRNRRISWRSLPGADVDNGGSVIFEPAGQSTLVRVELDYTPPAGKLGAAVARVFGEEPNQQVEEDLQRFKEVMESRVAV